MVTTDSRTPRRRSFTQYLSPSHHHNQTIRKRAQSLNAQAERKNSILRNGADGGGIDALSASEPLPPSPSILQSSSTTTSSSSSSSAASRRRSKPKPYHERQILFTTQQRRPVHKPGHISFASRRARPHNNEYVATTKRKIGKVSRITGTLYYVEESVPLYPYRSTCFSPPPIPIGRYDDESDSETPTNGCFRFLPRCMRTRFGAEGGTGTAVSNDEPEQDSFDSSPPPSPPPPVPVVGYPHSVDPLLYPSLSDKLNAHWGVFMVNMRFRIFRAQDRVKNGVARVGGILRRM